MVGVAGAKSPVMTVSIAVLYGLARMAVHTAMCKGEHVIS